MAEKSECYDRNLIDCISCIVHFGFHMEFHSLHFQIRNAHGTVERLLTEDRRPNFDCECRAFEKLFQDIVVFDYINVFLKMAPKKINNKYVNLIILITTNRKLKKCFVTNTHLLNFIYYLYIIVLFRNERIFTNNFFCGRKVCAWNICDTLHGSKFSIHKVCNFVIKKNIIERLRAVFRFSFFFLLSFTCSMFGGSCSHGFA